MFDVIIYMTDKDANYVKLTGESLFEFRNELNNPIGGKFVEMWCESEQSCFCVSRDHIVAYEYKEVAK